MCERNASNKSFDWNDVASAVCDEFDRDTNTRKYKHVVIDEGQDFSPQMTRSLAKAIPADGSLTFFGDMAQQIYGRRVSWKSAGLAISKVWEFKENYRNTKQIAQLGLAISAMPYFRGTPDLVEPVAPAAAGALPALVSCSSDREEIGLVRQLARESGRSQTVAVLYRTRALDSLVRGLLPSKAIRLHRDLTTWLAGPNVYYGTYHSSKGLEFDLVILPFLTKDRLPDRREITDFGEEEAKSQDGKLLYVAVTRAKARLVMSYTGKVTSLLPTEESLYQKRSL